jgi:hypothetical protein
LAPAIVGLIIGIGEVARRLALSRIPDLSRQRVVGMVRRLVTLLASVVAAKLGLASDVSSFATYFGLLTAGLAVALQNVNLATLGYLLLIGKRGIRLGDRVQVSDVTGNVIHMGFPGKSGADGCGVGSGRLEGAASPHRRDPMLLFLHFLAEFVRAAPGLSGRVYASL